MPKESINHPTPIRRYPANSSYIGFIGYIESPEGPRVGITRTSTISARTLQIVKDKNDHIDMGFQKN